MMGVIKMASVNFKKVKSKAETKALFRHDDEKERCQTEMHSNPHINKKLTHTNTSINNLSYAELCNKMENRIEYLDNTTNKNKRKDRVVCLRLEVPVPADLQADKHDEWFNRVNDIFVHVYGSDNVLEGVIHRDEIHDYFDVRTNEITTSREHGHFTVIPEVDGQLNAKKLVTKGSMTKINKAIHKMTLSEYDVDFMIYADDNTDDAKADKKSLGKVEELKIQSSKSLEGEIQYQRKQHKDLIKQNKELFVLNINAEDKHAQLCEDIAGLQQSIQQFEEDKNDFELKKAKFKKQQADFQAREDSFEAQKQIQEQDIKQRYAVLGRTERLVKADDVAKAATEQLNTQNSYTSRFVGF